MIWKIIFLLSFFNVLVNAGPSETNEPIQDAVKGNDVKDEWKKKFSKYDKDNDRSISPTELQTLLFNESIGFVTIERATNFIPFLDIGGEGKIRFDHLKQIEPIMDILSQWESLSLANNDEVDDNATVSVNFTKGLLYEKYSDIFESPNDVQEIINFMDKDGKGEIKINEVFEIDAMLGATVKLDKVVEIFSKLKSYGVTTNEDVDALMDLAILTKKRNNQTTKQSADPEIATGRMNTSDENDDGRIELFEFLKKCYHLNVDELTEFETFVKSLRVQSPDLIDEYY